ncbi:hypothetical protein VPH5P1C_0224 [Vibrio phage 5P1c]|nr:hypothetical protein VP495E541_P0223 [Vibrio phage 495E54-1]CAH9014633.1 hypothetical protein VP496E541_P0223 [Vibrio phage 496E54-1]
MYQQKSMADISHKGRIVVWDDQVVVTRLNVAADGYDAGYSDHIVFDKENFKTFIKELMEE